MSKFSDYMTRYLKEQDESKEITNFIDKYSIDIESNNVESFIALINKTIYDWNRDKDFDKKQINEIIINAIKEGLINI